MCSEAAYTSAMRSDPRDSFKHTMKNRCTAKTKKGARCKNAAQRGDRCLAHVPRKVREAAGFGGPQPGSGRPKKPRAVDVLRQRIEEDIDRWLQPLEDGLVAQRGIVVGDGPTAHVEYVEDHPTQIKAHREAFDRAFGRPTQPVADVTESIDDEIRDMLAEMDRKDPQRKAVAHANGNGRAPD
jgi:hypothetical protein